MRQVQQRWMSLVGLGRNLTLGVAALMVFGGAAVLTPSLLGPRWGSGGETPGGPTARSAAGLPDRSALRCAGLPDALGFWGIEYPFYPFWQYGGEAVRAWVADHAWGCQNLSLAYASVHRLPPGYGEVASAGTGGSYLWWESGAELEAPALAAAGGEAGGYPGPQGLPGGPTSVVIPEPVDLGGQPPAAPPDEAPSEKAPPAEVPPEEAPPEEAPPAEGPQVTSSETESKAPDREMPEAGPSEAEALDAEPPSAEASPEEAPPAEAAQAEGPQAPLPEIEAPRPEPPDAKTPDAEVPKEEPPPDARPPERLAPGAETPPQADDPDTDAANAAMSKADDPGASGTEAAGAKADAAEAGALEVDADALEPLPAAEEALLEHIRQDRKKAGLPPLEADRRLTELARLKSQDMVRLGYFSHTSPTYGSPFEMMRRAGVTYRRAAENLAQSGDASSAHQALMGSPGHRANLLDRHFTHIGVGVVAGRSGGVVVTQLFLQP